MVEVAPTAFGQVIGFLDGLGFFNVVLPFLIVFSITYAILEKTKILGDDQSNLNAIVAFCIGFFVIASARLVGILEDVLAKTMLLVIAGIAFMITTGVFSQKTTWFDFSLNDEGKYKDPKARFVTWFIFLILALIFLGAITVDTAAGPASLLSIIAYWLFERWNSGLVSGILLFILLIFAVRWMSSQD